MTFPDKQVFPDREDVLLTGDISRAFSNLRLPYHICTNMLEAIDAAAKTKYLAIGVVMPLSSSSLNTSLKMFREISGGAKIILLAQMYQEPVALQLVDSEHVADDYLICPTDIEQFCRAIAHKEERGQGESCLPCSGTGNDIRTKHLEKLATEDDLTGLKNKRYLFEFGRQIIEYVKNKAGQVTLLVFDIDNFKQYNDVYGHPAGDEILKETALLMRRCCRRQDIVGRIGGDEFAVIFWDEVHKSRTAPKIERRSAATEHPKQPIFITNRFRKELGETKLRRLGVGNGGVLTISGGLAGLSGNCSDINELFQQADKALLDAKRGGKNRVYLVGGPQEQAG